MADLILVKRLYDLVHGKPRYAGCCEQWDESKVSAIRQVSASQSVGLDEARHVPVRQPLLLIGETSHRRSRTPGAAPMVLHLLSQRTR